MTGLQGKGPAAVSLSSLRLLQSRPQEAAAFAEMALAEYPTDPMALTCLVGHQSAPDSGDHILQVTSSTIFLQVASELLQLIMKDGSSLHTPGRDRRAHWTESLYSLTTCSGSPNVKCMHAGQCQGSSRQPGAGQRPICTRSGCGRQLIPYPVQLWVGTLPIKNSASLQPRSLTWFDAGGA